MELGATVCGSRRASCGQCPAGPWCPSAGQVVIAPRAAKGSRPRFEDTDRYARGRVVAALAGGEPLPEGLGAERLERALAGLERDGLVVRAEDGAARLPG
jgi:A/G-specific adenine glycosylase